jgi:hypothetical protein
MLDLGAHRAAIEAAASIEEGIEHRVDPAEAIVRHRHPLEQPAPPPSYQAAGRAASRRCAGVVWNSSKLASRRQFIKSEVSHLALLQLQQLA